MQSEQRRKTGDSVIFKISSINQVAPREYIRVCFCYPAIPIGPSPADLTTRLAAATRHAVLSLPILAGTVRETLGSKQIGTIEVRVTLKRLGDFRPIVKECRNGQLPYTWAHLYCFGMPPSFLAGRIFTPLPDKAPGATNPAFAVQANLIDGGVLVALYVHRAVADIHGVASIVRLMSEASNCPRRRMPTLSELQHAADEHLRTVNRFSGTRFVEPGPQDFARFCRNRQNDGYSRGVGRVLAFSVDKLARLTQLVGERTPSGALESYSGYTCLIAVLWKAINRARLASGSCPYSRVTSALVMPIDVRCKIDAPATELFSASASLNARIGGLELLQTIQPYSPMNLEFTMDHIRCHVNRVDDSMIRGAIAVIERMRNVEGLSVSNSDLAQADIWVETWTPLGESNMAFDLGLGCPPQFVRQLNREPSQDAVVLILPPSCNGDIVEVQVELPERQMLALIRDAATMEWVEWVSA